MTHEQQVALVVGGVGLIALTALFFIEWRRMHKAHIKRVAEMDARHEEERKAILGWKNEWENYQNEKLYKPTKVSYLKIVR